MNFKTTSVLFALLLAVGVYIFLTRDAGTAPTTDTPSAKKLLSVNSADLQTVTVTPADGKPYSFTHVGAEWTLSKPVEAAAETGVVQALVTDLTGLSSTSSTDVTEGTGLSHPRFVVDLVTHDGKTTTLNVGDKSAVGDQLYVQVKGSDKANTVPAGVEEELDKPRDDFRQKKLISLATNDIKSIEIDRPAGPMKLVKDGQDWKITAPEAMPADTAAVTDLIMAATGVRATEFEDGADAALPIYGLGNNAKSITLSTAVPSTQPTTMPATGQVKLTIGLPDTILQKNLYVKLADAKAIVKVPKDSLAFIDKTPLDLRDKTVLGFDPKSVNSVAVNIDRPATTRPTTKPAEKQSFGVSRRPPPATMPTTSPTTEASTQPATQPTVEPKLSAWIANGPTTGEAPNHAANDAAIEAILAAFHPLKAIKYVAAAPTAGTTINVTIMSGGGGVWALAKTDFQIIDPGDSKPPIATYDGLHFEIDRPLLEKLEADFTKPGPPPAATPPAPSMEMGPQMMPQ